MDIHVEDIYYIVYNVEEQKSFRLNTTNSVIHFFIYHVKRFVITKKILIKIIVAIQI